MKLNDVITPDQLREGMFNYNDPEKLKERWNRCFDQVEPFAQMISEETRKRRVPIELGGAWMNLLVCLIDHLQEEEKRIA
jgi:hypothetical protein